METTVATPRTISKKRRNKSLKLVLAAAVGVVLGYSCPYWPERLQPVCMLSAKLIGIFTGAM